MAAINEKHKQKPSATTTNTRTTSVRLFDCMSGFGAWSLEIGGGTFISTRVVYDKYSPTLARKSLTILLIVINPKDPGNEGLVLNLG